MHRHNVLNTHITVIINNVDDMQEDDKISPAGTSNFQLRINTKSRKNVLALVMIQLTTCNKE